VLRWRDGGLGSGVCGYERDRACWLLTRGVDALLLPEVQLTSQTNQVSLRLPTTRHTGPCHKPGNEYSNKRWCCGDTRHLDLSWKAFEQIANPDKGVVAVRFKRVGVRLICVCVCACAF